MEYELYSQIFEENLRRMSEDDIVKVIDYYNNKIENLILERKDFIEELENRKIRDLNKRLILKQKILLTCIIFNNLL